MSAAIPITLSAAAGRISGEMRVMLALLEKVGGVEMASARLRRRSTTARSFLQAKRKVVRLEQQQQPSAGTDMSAGPSPSG